MNSFLSKPLGSLLVRFGVHGFHLTGVLATIHPTGSGDTALAYVGFACGLVFAVLGEGIWSWPARRRGEYRTLDAWLLLLSFTLAATLFTYGFIKIFPGQFQPPSLYMLTRTFGGVEADGVALNVYGGFTLVHGGGGGGGGAGRAAVFQENADAGCAACGGGANEHRGAEPVLRRAGKAVQRSPAGAVGVAGGTRAFVCSFCAARVQLGSDHVPASGCGCGG